MAADRNRVGSMDTGRTLLNTSMGVAKEGAEAAGYYNALVEASNNPLIDSYSRAQFSRAAAESSPSSLTPTALRLAMETRAAAAGEGLYGIRRKNEELAKLLLEKPGSKQTLLSVNVPNQPGSVTQTNLLGS